MKRLPIFTLALSMAAAATAQTEVAVFTPGLTADGICYFLPETRLHLTVEAQREVRTPGEYAPYASHFLRQDNVPQQKEENWQLTTVSVVPYGVADPSRAFSIKLKAKTSAPLVTLAPDGCLLAVNAEAPQPQPLTQASSEQLPATMVDADKCKTPEMLAATSRRKAAELAAAEICDIRENRSLLMKGQADFMPKDGEQLKQMLAGLTRQEEGLTQLFCGWTAASRHTFTFGIRPANFEGARQVAFRFSPQLGVLPAEAADGEPYYFTFANQHTLPAEDPSQKGSRKEQEDLRYCVSSNVLVTLTDSHDNIVWQQTLPFAQVGRIEHLGGELFNKKQTTHVWLNPTTGGLQKLDATP